MIIDANDVLETRDIDCDLCLVGTGPAGFSLAREFSGTRLKVVVLEAGDAKYTDESQKVYSGKSSFGLTYPALSSVRSRFLGGSSNCWVGWCRELNDIDFEVRKSIHLSGWPLTKESLKPYYKRAHAICQLGPYDYDLEAWERILGARRLPLDPNRIITEIAHHSPPTRFGEVYRKDLEDSANINVYLNASVVELETNDGMSATTRAIVGKYNNKRFGIRAKHYVIATGGLENPRILLNSRSRSAKGIGNQHDLVGRYFMEHPYITEGEVVFSDPSLISGLHLVPEPSTNRLGPPTDVPLQLAAGLRMPDRLLRQEQLANVMCTLGPIRDEKEIAQPTKSEREAIQSARELWHGLETFSAPEDFGSHLGRVLRHLDFIAYAAYERTFNRKPKGRREPVPPSKSGRYKVTTNIEQVPDANSRVFLVKERDRFGKNRIGLNWSLSEIEKHSVRRFQDILSRALGSSGLGRMRITLNDDAKDLGPTLSASYHHMGTTRMSRDPKSGVVDENCRVHGVRNLYMAGSSVFPTSGAWNPTLTIVALSLRLADHLRKEMKA